MVLNPTESTPSTPRAEAAPRQLPVTSSATPLPVNDHVFLVGRPPISDLLGFVRSMVPDDQRSSQATLAQQWRDANDHVRVLEQAEAGAADNHPVQPLPPELSPLVDEVRAMPMFQSAFGLIPTEFALVDLDRLVVFQKHINLGYVGALKTLLTEQPALVDVARLAFGLSRPPAPVRVMQDAPNRFTIVSPSNDLRLLEAVSVDPNAMPGPVSSGRPVTRIVLNIGFGSNYLNAVAVNGRLVLNNGSHRAFALRSLGITHAPCLVQYVSRQEELELIGGELAQQPERYFSHPRPPMLKDYFDSRLCLTLPVLAKHRMVRISFGAETSDIPAP